MQEAQSGLLIWNDSNKNTIELTEEQRNLRRQILMTDQQARKISTDEYYLKLKKKLSELEFKSEFLRKQCKDHVFEKLSENILVCNVCGMIIDMGDDAF